MIDCDANMGRADVLIGDANANAADFLMYFFADFLMYFLPISQCMHISISATPDCQCVASFDRKDQINWTEYILTVKSSGVDI